MIFKNYIFLVLIFTLISYTNLSYLDDKDNYLKKQIEELPYKIKKVYEDSEEVTEIVKNITGIGYEKIVQRSEYQKLEGLESEYLENFIDDLFEGIKLNLSQFDSTKIKKILLDILNSENKEKELRTFQIVYDEPKSNKLTAIYLVIEYLIKSKEIDLVYTVSSSQQKLQPNLLVIKTTKVENGIISDEMSIVEEEKLLFKNDISAVLDYIEIIALKKCSENFNGKFSCQQIKS